MFFSANKDTTDKILLWETFKAYARGVCITPKAYLNRKRKTLLDERLVEIRALERKYEWTNSKDMKNEIELKINIVKKVDAT